MSAQVELDLGHVGLQPAPISDGPQLLVVVGADRDSCRRLTVAHWLELRLATWVLSGEELPHTHLNVAFATPREKLPEDLRRQLDDLELAGALTTWSPS